MLIQEPIQAAVWHALNNYAFQDARFIAERLHAEVHSDDTLFLLATCYYRSGNIFAAYSVLKGRGCRTPQCRYLFAKCCFDLKKFSEAEFAVSGSVLGKVKTWDEIISDFGDLASFAIQLLGHICYKTSRCTKAAEAYSKSLKLNPFMWSSFENLANLGEKPDAAKIFDYKNFDHLSSCQGSSYLVNLVNKSLVPNAGNFVKESPNVYPDITQDSSQAASKVSVVPASPTPTVCNNHSPVVMLRPSPDVCVEVFTPETNTWVSFSYISKNHKRVARSNLFNAESSNSPLSPCFGVLPLSTPVSNQDGDSQSTANLKKSTSKRCQDLNPPKFQIFSQSGNKNNNSTLPQTPQASLPPVSISNVRRSSRLFSSSNSVKENKGSTRTARFISAKVPPKKPKAKASRAPTNEPKEMELNEMNKADVLGEKNKVYSNATTVVQAAVSLQKASVEGLFQLLQELGSARVFLAHVNMKNAIKTLQNLPPQHFLTALVQSMLGKAYFELSDYTQSIYHYEEARKYEPYHVEGMEYYSTALWHQQKEVTLSSLAQELTEFNSESPETWCVAGNCFSLQKEHETAIKFLKRATQVDPDFVYAYNLLGHEYVMTEEMEKAMTCFRNATRIDPRHYNAWYGIGMIYYKQEKFNLAEVHYRRALAINPESAILMCHVGVVQHSLNMMEKSLATLNKAVAMDPKNPLCKFHRASVYFSLERNGEALKDLEELKQIVPKESLVHFLLGKVHKKLGNSHLTLMNFSWATDLDPRGVNSQIKGAIDKQYNNEDDEATVPAANNDLVVISDLSSSEVIDDSLNNSAQELHGMDSEGSV